MPRIRIKTLVLRIKDKFPKRINTLSSYRGFTLIELLIAISLISIVAVTGIPNLRRFNQGQEVTSASGDIVTSLRTIQSNDMAGLKCTKSTTYSNPNGWSLQLTRSGSPVVSGYQILQDCTNESGVSEDPSLVFATKTFPSNIALNVTIDGAVTNCSTINNLNIKFSSNQLSLSCLNSSNVTITPTINSYVDIAVSSGLSSQSKTVRVYKGGSIGVR